MAVIKLQPSSFTDQIVDGHELTKLPYPFYVEEDGSVQRQEFWKGDPYRVIGFQKDLARHEIDLLWQDATKDPQQVVGMYVVTADEKGDMGVHVSAISNVDVLKDDRHA